MGSEWKKVSLADLYDVTSGLSKPASEFGSGFPFLAFTDVFNNYFVPKELSGLVQSNPKEQEKCSVRRGDVFLTRTSETMHELGMSSVALKDYKNATFNGFTKRLRPKKGIEILPEYVGYYLRSQIFRNEMLSFSTMSTRASLNNSMIKQLTMPVPPKGTQQSIAWILKNLDDKIELNRQMNETLESMAQALFKSWFVDFDPVIDNALAAGNPIPDVFAERAEQRRKIIANAKKASKAGVPFKGSENNHQSLFPSEFEFTEEMGWIPKGWESTAFGDHINFQTGPAFKSKEFSDSGVKLARGDNVKEGRFQWGKKARYWPVLEESLDKFLLKSGDVLLGMDGSKVGKNRVRVSETDLPCLLVQRVARLSKKNTICSSFIYLVVNGQRFRDYVEVVKTGSAIPHISGGQIKALKLVLPKDEKSLIYSEFELIASSFFDRIEGMVGNSLALSKLRDTLLPKLLSGELRIPEAEKLIDELIV